MLKCVNCGYENSVFNVSIVGRSQGVFTYVARCPRCSSCMTKYLPGYYEADLRIGFLEKGATKLNRPIIQKLRLKRKATGKHFGAGMSSPPKPNTRPPVGGRDVKSQEGH